MFQFSARVKTAVLRKTTIEGFFWQTGSSCGSWVEVVVPDGRYPIVTGVESMCGMAEKNRIPANADGRVTFPPPARVPTDWVNASTFHFVPASCSWLNAIEGFFAKPTRRRSESAKVVLGSKPNQRLEGVRLS